MRSITPRGPSSSTSTCSSAVRAALSGTTVTVALAKRNPCSCKASITCVFICRTSTSEKGAGAPFTQSTSAGPASLDPASVSGLLKGALSIKLNAASTAWVEAAFNFMDKAPLSNPLTEAGSKEAGPAEVLWVKGAPAPFSEVDVRQMKTQVIDALHEHGFLFAKATVTVVPDKAARTAELQVEVLEEGPRGGIDRIELVGNKKNSPEAVLRYLDLKPGMELSSQLVATIEDRLWRAARFLSYKVSLGSPDAGGRVPLQIQVVEYDEAPPLEQEFSRVEQAMLKLREWLSKLDERRDDMTINLSGAPAPGPEVELVLSPLSGLTVRAQAPARPAAAHDDYAVVLKAGLARFYSPAGGRKLLIGRDRKSTRL